MSFDPNQAAGDEGRPRVDHEAHERDDCGAQQPSDREADRLAALEILRLKANNAGPLSLSGTNTWVVGRDPAFVIDPGPALAEHVGLLVQALAERGGLGGIALTHDHPDHAEAVTALRAQMPAPLAAGRAESLREPGDILLTDGLRFGPLQALATPGHAPDHFALLYRGACFTGDAVLGEGSVFIAPDPGALAAYLGALRRLLELPLELLCPGHGPVVLHPQAKLREYLLHRLDRERLLLEALSAGRRSVAELLDAAWSDVPHAMRPFAAITLSAHLDKLAEEDRLPAGVERPSRALPFCGR